LEEVIERENNSIETVVGYGNEAKRESMCIYTDGGRLR
jgi:hypothetical protein